MSKKDKKKEEAKTEAAPKKPTPPKIERPKYGVPELAEALGIKASSVRVQLRNAKIPKAGKLYGWESKDEMQKVIDKLKSRKAERKPKKTEEDDSDDDDDDDDE